MSAKQILKCTVPHLSFACLLFTALLAGCITTYPGATHGLSVDGTIQSIDLRGRQLTVAPFKPSAPVVVVWESTTKFWKNAFPIRPDAVEPGRNARIYYHEESGRLVAHHVYVRAPYAHE